MDENELEFSLDLDLDRVASERSIGSAIFLHVTCYWDADRLELEVPPDMPIKSLQERILELKGLSWAPASGVVLTMGAFDFTEEADLFSAGVCNDAKILASLSFVGPRKIYITGETTKGHLVEDEWNIDAEGNIEGEGKQQPRWVRKIVGNMDWATGTADFTSEFVGSGYKYHYTGQWQVPLSLFFVCSTCMSRCAGDRRTTS